MARSHITKHRRAIPVLQGHTPACRSPVNTPGCANVLIVYLQVDCIFAGHILLSICLWGFSLWDLTGKIRRMKNKKSFLTPPPTCSRWTSNYSTSLYLSWENLRETLVGHICLVEISNTTEQREVSPPNALSQSYWDKGNKKSPFSFKDHLIVLLSLWI